MPQSSIWEPMVTLWGAGRRPTAPDCCFLLRRVLANPPSSLPPSTPSLLSKLPFRSTVIWSLSPRNDLPNMFPRNLVSTDDNPPLFLVFFIFFFFFMYYLQFFVPICDLFASSFFFLLFFFPHPFFKDLVKTLWEK